MTTTSPTWIISVLSLMVAILAVFVARSNVQRQIQVTAREAWMREFREQVAAFLNCAATLDYHARNPPPDEQRMAALDALGLRIYTIRLLIAEKESQYAAFASTMKSLVWGPPTEEDPARAARVREVQTAAEAILQRERAAIEAPDMMERARIWLGKVGERPWSRVRAWSRRGPPRFP
jgi:hypothetical protein